MEHVQEPRHLDLVRAHAARLEDAGLLLLRDHDGGLAAGAAELVPVDLVVDVVVHHVEVLHDIDGLADAPPGDERAEALHHLGDLGDALAPRHGGLRSWEGLVLPVVQAHALRRREARRRLRVRVPGREVVLARELVEVPDLGEDAAEGGVALVAAADELVVVLELLPGHEVRRVGALAPAVGHDVLQRVHELLVDVLRVAGAVGEARVAVGVVAAVHEADVDEALGARVEPAEGPADRRPALGVGLLLDLVHQVVVSDRVRLVAVAEAVEDLLDLRVRQGAAVLLVEDLGQGHRKVLDGHRPGVGGVRVAEHARQGGDAPRTLAVDEALHPHERVLRRDPELPGPLILAGLGGAAHAGDEVRHELLVADEAVLGVAAVDGAEVLVAHAGAERQERALELLEVHPAGALEVVVAERLAEVGVLAHAGRDPLLNLRQDHLLQLV
mmetsp:Transcript_60458/g.177308  ORF Transcript_60458/g.177308 Transcript_60458/m.177308 type:complete len:443 (-) Transcript_60458:112-1440(-)